MPSAGITILFFPLMAFGDGFFLRKGNTEALVAKYAIAKKKTETEINRLKPPTIEAISAVTL